MIITYSISIYLLGCLLAYARMNANNKFYENENDCFDFTFGVITSWPSFIIGAGIWFMRDESEKEMKFLEF